LPGDLAKCLNHDINARICEEVSGKLPGMKMHVTRTSSLRLAVFFVTLLSVAPAWLYGQTKAASPTITVYKTPT